MRRGERERERGGGSSGERNRGEGGLERAEIRGERSRQSRQEGKRGQRGQRGEGRNGGAKFPLFRARGPCVCVCGVRDQKDGTSRESSRGASSLVSHEELVEVGLRLSLVGRDDAESGGLARNGEEKVVHVS